MTVSQITGLVLKPFAYFLEKDDMKLLGLGTTMPWAHRYNCLSYGTNQKMRQRLFREQFEALMKENGPPQHAPIEMNDGWAIDRSMTLSHLQQLLKDSAEIIENRGQKPTNDFGKPFLLSIMKQDDIARAQRGPQDLLDVGAERVAVHRSIEHRRRGQLCGAERRHDRVCLPMAARRVIPNAGPAQAPRVAA